MPLLDYLYTLPNATNGTDQILIETVTAVPSLAPLLLVFIFFLVFLGGIARQKLRIGNADYSMWAVVASLATFMVSLIMTTITGLLRLDILVIMVAVTILTGVWFFLDRRASEV